MLTTRTSANSDEVLDKAKSSSIADAAEAPDQMAEIEPAPTEKINQVELAHRIRKLRLDRGMTIEDASGKSALTKSWWSKVENFRLTPSLPALFRVASVLGVSIAKLLEGLDARPPLVVVRPNDRQKFTRDSEVSQVVYESLAHPRPNRKMDPMVLTIEPHAERALALSHQGEEFIFIIAGKIVLEYGSQKVELSVGDSAYYDATVDHRMINEFDVTAQVVCVQDMGGVSTGSFGR